jgi:hypothetical protein
VPSGGLAALALLGAVALRRRARVALRTGAALAFAATFGACGSDEVVLGSDPLTSGGTAGTGVAGRGGSGGGSGGTGAVSAGGSGAIDGSAGTGATGGGGNGGSGGTRGPDAAGGSGGADAGDASDGSTPSCRPERSEYVLEICKRLSDSQWNTGGQQAATQFVQGVTLNCNVARLTREHPFPPDLFNALFEWSVTLWGCPREATGVTTFGLVGQPAFGVLPAYLDALSAADAGLLIDIYVGVVSVRLALSSEEQTALRRALECLAKGAITNPSTTEHELSNCVPDAGPDAAGDVTSDAADAATE